VSSTIQASVIGRLGGDSMAVVMATLPRLFALNLVYWYVPALATPAILALATRYLLGRVGWSKLVLVHLPGALVYAALHSMIMIGMRVALFSDGFAKMGKCWSCVARTSLEQLDWLLMTYLFVVGLAHALAYRRESEARALNSAQLETSLVEAQLQALQRQVHPHFLFNTLNTISGLMRSNVCAADKMIAQLGDLLRMTLHTSGTHLSLKDELDVLQKYLEIEQTRFGGRLSIDMQVDPETLDAQLPTLLLQPLVENAVRHGIAPNTRPGWIAIRAKRAGSRLAIDIRDSGDGLPPDRLMALNRGVGLNNTRARLQHLYQSDFAFTFSNIERGFCVTVSIPFHAEMVQPQVGVA
jgi:signal transduction histidine kinase